MSVASFALLAMLPAAEPVRITHSSTDQALTEGEVVVDATLADVDRVLKDVTTWPRVFTDVRSTVTKPTKDCPAAFVLDSKALGHAHTFCPRAMPDGIRLDILDGHGTAVLIELTRTEARDRGTRIKGRLRLEMSGPLSLLVSEASLREKREQKLRVDLLDLRRFFEKRAAPK